MLGMFKEQEVADAAISESVTGTSMMNEWLRSRDGQIIQREHRRPGPLLCGKCELSEQKYKA